MASYLFSACCRKVDCTEYHTIPVVFAGFTQDELDTIYTTGYEWGSSFTEIAVEQLRDTVIEDEGKQMLMHDYLLGANIVERDYPLFDSYEWELYIPSVNRRVRIYNYKYTNFKCSACFPVERADRATTLHSCNVNDSGMRAQNVVIYR